MKIKIKNRVYNNNIPYTDYNDKEDYKKLAKYMYELGFGYWKSEELYDLWDSISDKYCADWLIIPDNIDDFKKYLSSIAISYENDEEKAEYNEDEIY